MTPAPDPPGLSSFRARISLLLNYLAAVTALLVCAAAPALGIEDRDSGPNPVTPVIGIEPYQLDFATCLEPGVDCDDRTFEVFNDVSDPTSILEVTHIVVAGTYVVLGPQLPIQIPGDGTRITFTARFCPETGHPTPGMISVYARRAVITPRLLPCSGDANLPPLCEAGGPYQGFVGIPLLFNGSESDDQDPEGQIVSYTWDFGDGSSGTGALVEHAYSATGTYAVLLTVVDNCGIAAGCSTLATIGPGNIPPVCNAGGPYSGFDMVPLQLDGRGSFDPDGLIVNYSWSFGDNSFGNGPTPTHVWNNPGTYIVGLTVTDNGGRTSSCQTQAVIAFNAAPVCDHGGPYQGVVGTPIQFDGTGSFDPDGQVTSYLWNFGDGSTSTLAAPLHAYAVATTYSVTLTVRDDRGRSSMCFTIATVTSNQPPSCDAGGPYLAAIGASIQFDGTGSFDPDGTIVLYQWTFGDGSSGNGPTPTHAYSAAGDYTVQLCVRDNLGANTCCTTTARVIGGGSPITPVIGIDPTVLDFGDCIALGVPTELPLEVFNDVFDPSSILHLTAAVLTGNAFEFVSGPSLPVDIPGDGSRMTFVYRFTPATTDLAVGEVELTAPNAINSPREVLLRGRGNVSPICDAGGPYQGGTGLPIVFDGSNSEDPGGQSLDFHWDFGDGQTGSGVVVSHTYVQAGIFQVTLTLADNCAVTAACTTSAAVLATPICDAGGPYIGSTGIPVVFDGSGSFDPDGVIVSYEWDFGDGGTGTGPFPIHTYNQNGTFTVTLMVTDDDGFSSSCQTFVFIGAATPVEISSFRAVPQPHRVEITWTFLAEGDFLGFELWRQEVESEPKLKLHPGLLADEDHDGEITFQDARVQSGSSYDYTLIAFDRGGAGEPVGSLHVKVPLPALGLQIVPNPSRPPISVAADLPVAGRARVWIADATGRIVRSLAEDYRPAGRHALPWDGRDGRGVSVASGVYFAVVELEGQIRREKLVLVR